MPEYAVTPNLMEHAVSLMTPAEKKLFDELTGLQVWCPIGPDEKTKELSPQELAFNSKADILGYGGAAGGGKTDLICGLSMTKQYRSIIYRKEAKQLLGITERFTQLRGGTLGYNSQQGVWRIPEQGRFVQFGGIKDPGDHRSYQGQDHDFKAFDEVTEMREAQVRFLMGWLRSSNPQIRCRILMTFNPPTTVEGRWIIEYFGPWLDPKHPNPAKVGELRWYTTDPDGVDYPVASNKPFIWTDDWQEDGPCYDLANVEHDEHDVVTPMSRTFIPAKVEDNPYYMETGYKRILQAMPEPLRSQMLLGDFTAGIEDDPWQVCPTAWVEAAMARWREPESRGAMTMVGVDPSRGGSDETVIARRHAMWFDKIKAYPGAAVPDGPVCAGLVLGEIRNKAPVNVDAIGIGSSVYDHLKTIHSRTRGVNVSESDKEAMCEKNLFHFVNLRAEMFWRVREALDPANDTGICLPDNKKLKADLTAITWKLAGAGRIQMESKDDIKARLGRSTDYGDAVALTFLRGALASTGRQSSRGPQVSIA
jgi:hypothetical protein